MRRKGEQGTQAKPRALLLRPVTGQGCWAEDEQDAAYTIPEGPWNGELRAAHRRSSEQAGEVQND